MFLIRPALVLLFLSAPVFSAAKQHENYVSSERSHIIALLKKFSAINSFDRVTDTRRWLKYDKRFMDKCNNYNVKVNEKTSYKAAVYEHVPITPAAASNQTYSSSYARKIMRRNIEIYEHQANLASQQNVDLIVFPEDGIYGIVFTRDSIVPFLETIPPVPNSKQPRINPCDLYAGDESRQNQRLLSCIARKNRLYLVANIGEIEYCDRQTDPNCPHDGRYQYNVNVVYDSDGYFVSKFRKVTLYYEKQFNTPRIINYKENIFTTPFGRIATFVCFDVLFERPAIPLVEEYGIDSVAFPTAWGSKLPLMTGNGFHESWARYHGVNFLAAQLHLPIIRFTGSGIYSGADGVKAYYRDKYLFSSGRLVISEVPVKAKKREDLFVPRIPESIGFNKTFESVLLKDTYRMVALRESQGVVKIQNKNTTCLLRFKLQTDLSLQKSSKKEKFAFGIFDGLHRSAHNSYLQVCVLLKCADPNDLATCGAPVEQSLTAFERFEIVGQFTTPYVYPTLLADEAKLVNKGWKFIADRKNNRAQITYRNVQKLNLKILVSALYGRKYENDYAQN